MRMRAAGGLVFLLAMLHLASPAYADTWRAPVTRQYRSADGAWRLTVEPRVSSDPRRHLGDRHTGEDRTHRAADDIQAAAIGTMERCIHGVCSRSWRRNLFNAVAPVSVIVTDDGHVMTLDNWSSMGFGPHAVVLYDPAGSPVANYALTDFLPEEYVMALPRSVSSLHWRGSPRIDRDSVRIVVPVVVPSEAADEEDNDHTHYVDVVFDPRDGAVTLPASDAWSPALQQAASALASQRAMVVEELERALAPLLPPDSTDLRDWHAYLRDAYSRLEADDTAFPATLVLPHPTAPDYDKEAKRLRARLHETHNPDVIMLAALSQDALLDVLKQEAASFRHGVPTWPRIYLLLDEARFRQASVLFASGTTLIRLDPARAIPQRVDYLEAWENYLRGRPDSE